MIEDKCAYTTYIELVSMALDINSIMRAILAEATEAGTHEIKAYVVEHQHIHSRLMQADLMGYSEESTHQAHMNRFLDRLASERN